jgi:hypothetical protein
MVVLYLAVEKWVSNSNESDFIENQDWSQIEAAIHELDGKSKTLVTLGADNDTYMTIGSGEYGKYVVSVAFDNISFHNLVDLSKPDATEKLVVGGQ